MNDVIHRILPLFGRFPLFGNSPALVRNICTFENIVVDVVFMIFFALAWDCSYFKVIGYTIACNGTPE